MLGRTITVMAAGVMLAAPAGADPQAFCGGKYAAAAGIIDAAYEHYETLYSGGNHFHRLEGVGATIDVYRLMKGYPDISLRREMETPRWRSELWGDERQGDLGDTLTAEQAWSRGAWAWKAGAAADADPKARFWAGWGADIITSAGPTPDWWLDARTDDPDLTQSQTWVAGAAKTTRELNWLQMVLAGSNAPWANVWVDERQYGRVAGAHQRIADEAMRRYNAGDGLEWLVAAAINTPDGLADGDDVKVSIDALQDKARKCKASEAEYGALAASWPARERLVFVYPIDGEIWLDEMPAQIRRIVALQKLRAELKAPFSLSWRFEHMQERIDHLEGVSVDDPAWQEGFALFRLYTASDLDKVPVSSAPKMLRAYNLLSADDMATIGQRENADPQMVRVAFARHVALGNAEKAEKLLPMLKANSPDQAAMITRIWSSDEPRPVKLALIVINYPGLASFVKLGDRWAGQWDYPLQVNDRYVGKRRNLPQEYRTAGPLQRDYQVAAMSDDGSYWTMRGAAIPWVDRFRRPDSRVELNKVGRLIPDGPDEAIAFNKLIAWSELSRLTGGERLMHTLSRTLIPWAEKKGGSAGAEALARLVELCRFNSCGEIGGKPAQGWAFALLKRRMGGTDAAKRTKVWWPSPEDG